MQYATNEVEGARLVAKSRNFERFIKGGRKGALLRAQCLPQFADIPNGGRLYVIVSTYERCELCSADPNSLTGE